MEISQELEARLDALAPEAVADKKRMFGGVGYFDRGNLWFAVHGETLILRLGPDGAARALTEPHVRPFDITGRPMRGWVMVEPPGYDGEALARWLGHARSFVQTLGEPSPHRNDDA